MLTDEQYRKLAHEIPGIYGDLLRGIYEAGRKQALGEMGWQPIETAPKDIEILIYTDGLNMYIAHSGNHRDTGEQAWIVCEWGDEGDQAIVKNATKWHPLPNAPKDEVQS